MSDSSIAVSKQKHSLLPVLVVLFLVAYGLMTMLIVEQGNTIESQRLLIRQLFSDSAELSAIKGREAAAKHRPAPAPAKPETRHAVPPPVRPRPKEPRMDSPQAPADLQHSLLSI